MSSDVENFKRLDGWFIIHTMAINATTPKKMEAFVDFMQTVCDNHRCQNCSYHCKKYLSEHPVSKEFNRISESGRSIGCFYWSWQFHNAVNRRLGKPVMDYITAYEMYLNKKDQPICHATCSSDDES
jgi:hypothetical protein